MFRKVPEQTDTGIHGNIVISYEDATWFWHHQIQDPDETSHRCPVNIHSLARFYMIHFFLKRNYVNETKIFYLQDMYIYLSKTASDQVECSGNLLIKFKNTLILNTLIMNQLLYELKNGKNKTLNTWLCKWTRNSGKIN